VVTIPALGPSTQGLLDYEICLAKSRCPSAPGAPETPATAPVWQAGKVPAEQGRKSHNVHSGMQIDEPKSVGAVPNLKLQSPPRCP